MLFELYTIPFNEEWLLKKMVVWYREKLQGHDLIINVYDNESTDNTAAVAKELGCNVIKLDTEGEIRDDIYIDLFNNMWKKSTADFVILVSTDEFIDIVPEDLIGYTIARCIGYNMISDGTQDIFEVDHGLRFTPQDKACIFSPRDITEINYSPGAHYCNPTGNILWAVKQPVMYHMCMISKEWMIFRYKRGRERLSKVNKDKGWGAHFGNNDTEIGREFDHAWDLKQKVK